MARTNNLSNFLTDVADAIRTKTGGSAPIAAENFDTEIESISGGGEATVEKDVNFYDYDGTLVKSYTKNEFLELNSMPANPTHEGLTAQGWNWSLNDAQEYVQNMGALDVGQNYITDDGKTRIYITLNEETLAPYLGFYIRYNFTANINIDWGDGTTETYTAKGTGQYDKMVQHQYSSPGNYIIKLSSNAVNNECVGFVGDNVKGNRGSYIMSAAETGNDYERNRKYQSTIKKIEMGEYFGLYEQALAYCTNIETISLAQNTKISTLGSMALNLKCFVEPSGSTVGSSPYILNAYGLDRYICKKRTTEYAPTFSGDGIVRLTLTGNFASTIRDCGCLKEAYLDVSNNNLGTNCFSDDYRLKKVVLRGPIKTIDDYAFNNCYSLGEITLPPSVTSIRQSAFYGCKRLLNINIPNGVTTIEGSAFYGCECLLNVTLPDTVNNIGGSCFSGCYSLTNVRFSPNVPTINSYIFASCKSLKEVDFSDYTTIPTLSNTNAFNNIPSTCKFIVPDDLYEDWIVATNWSNLASYIIKKSDWDALQNA